MQYLLTKEELDELSGRDVAKKALEAFRRTLGKELTTRMRGLGGDYRTPHHRYVLFEDLKAAIDRAEEAFDEALGNETAEKSLKNEPGQRSKADDGERGRGVQ